MVFLLYIRMYFIIVIGGLFAVAFFNYQIDSLSLFHTNTKILNAVQHMQKGYGVDGLNNVNDRLLQKLVIDTSNHIPDTIVLGSSRIMYLDNKFLKPTSNIFFNHWVSGANLKDYISILGIYLKDKKQIPKNIIIGLDPWIFNYYTDDNHSNVLDKYYTYMLSILNHKISNTSYKKENLFAKYSKYKELINFSYTKVNFKEFKERLKNDKISLKYIKNTIDSDYRTAYGNIYQSQASSNPDVQHTQLLVDNYLYKGHKGYMDRFEKISNKDLFNNLITYLLKTNHNITFILLPFHPIVYDYFISSSKYNIIIDVEKYIKKYAQEHNIKVFGSYNPKQLNLDNRYFTDSIHGTYRVIQNIVKDKKDMAK